MYPKVIAFSGRKHCGKSTLANLCASKYGFQVLYFADGLKNLVCTILGISRETLELEKDMPRTIHIDPTLIEKTFRICQVRTAFHSIRDLMQYLGTDIIRTTNPRWHIDQLAMSIQSDKVCIGDCRFPNELEFIRGIGGEAWFISRPTYVDDVSNHESETSLRWIDFDQCVLINDSTQDALLERWSAYMDTGDRPPMPSLPTREDVLALMRRVSNPLVLEDLKRLLVTSSQL